MRVIQIPVLADNYTYLIICEKTDKAAVVDSPDASATRNAAKKANVELVAIIDTHHHWDHIGANEDFLSKQKIPVYAGSKDQDRIYGLSNPLDEGDEVKIGSLSFKILFIPGHTRAHIAYVGHGAVFCGDTLFVGGCGRLFEGSPEQMVNSLTKLKNLPDETKVYCMHEYTQKNLEFALTVEPNNPALKEKYDEVISKRKQNQPTVPSTIGEEKTYNPFLRWDSPELIENVKKDNPGISDDPVSIFEATRSMKDFF